MKKTYLTIISEGEEKKQITLSFDMKFSKINYLNDKFGLTIRNFEAYNKHMLEILYSTLDKEFKKEYDINKFEELLDNDEVTIEELDRIIEDLLIIAYPKKYKEELKKLNKNNESNDDLDENIEKKQ